MSDSTDYDAVNVPEGKPRDAYSYVERRGEILSRVERAGHPNALNKSELAREYGVNHTSIGRDFDALAEYVAENLDRNHSFIMDRVLCGAVRNLVEDGEHYKAAEKWYDLVAVGKSLVLPSGANSTWRRLSFTNKRRWKTACSSPASSTMQYGPI